MDIVTPTESFGGRSDVYDSSEETLEVPPLLPVDSDSRLHRLETARVLDFRLHGSRLHHRLLSGDARVLAEGHICALQHE